MEKYEYNEDVRIPNRCSNKNKRKEDKKMKEFALKKFRFVYWFGSCITDCYIKAYDEQEATERFKELTNDKRIVSIEEVN